VITTTGGWCSSLSDGMKRDFIDDNCVNNGTLPSIPIWRDQFISDFHLYIEKYGDTFMSNGAVIYDWTKKVYDSVLRYNYTPLSMAPPTFTGYGKQA